MLDSAPDEHQGSIRENAAEGRRNAARPVGALLVAAGVVHLLVPRLLLRAARLGYDHVLDVQFRPREQARTRVRTLGLLLLAAGGHLLYHGAVVPARLGRR